MNIFDEINTFGSYFLTDLHEPEDNTLFLEIKKSLTSDVKEDLKIGETIIEDLSRIYIDENSAYFTILFKGYVSYHVIDEGFCNFNERQGKLIKGKLSFFVYSESTYLDFILKETYANEMFPGDLKHYCLYCLNHVIHIVSLTDPIIESINSIEE